MRDPASHPSRLPRAPRAAPKASRWLVLPLALICLIQPACDDSEPFVPVPAPIDSPDKLIQTLARAYAERRPELFASILANDADHQAEYLFLLSDPTPENETQWGHAEETRIHRRMFDPAHPDPGDTAVPPAIWLQNLTITLTLEGEFTERTDLYTAQGGYLDRAKWKATAATYSAFILFELAGDTDYRVEGRANFVVLEDLEKPIGDAGKFLLLIWEDLGSSYPALTSRETSWGAIKNLYR